MESYCYKRNLHYRKCLALLHQNQFRKADFIFIVQPKSIDVKKHHTKAFPDVKFVKRSLSGNGKRKTSSVDLSVEEDCSLLSQVNSANSTSNSLQEAALYKESLNRAVSKSSTIKCLTNIYDGTNRINSVVKDLEISEESADGLQFKDELEPSQLSKEAWKEIKLQTYTTEIFNDINKTLCMSTIIPEATNEDLKDGSISKMSEYFQSKKFEELQDISNNFTKFYGIQAPVISSNNGNIDFLSIVQYSKEQKKYETEERPEVCLPLISNDVLDECEQSNRTWSCVYLAHLLERMLKTTRKQKVDIIWKRTRTKMIENCKITS